MRVPMVDPHESPTSTKSLSQPSRQMKMADDVDELREQIAEARRRGDWIGAVPTMGALHAGHLSLMETARLECDFVVATIFVNPTQFGPNEDFERYPRTLEQDLAACSRAGVDLVFCPTRDLMYPDEYGTFVEVEGLTNVWEGAFRPGHFRGVATIVLKLLNCIAPDVAYFGRKDYQQQALIRKMCRELDLPVEIRTCPTVREADGLALSSRNQYLSPAERQSALALSQCLRLARNRLTAGETDVAAVRAAMREQLDRDKAIQVDYVTVAHPETLRELSEPLPEMVALVAARIGRTRLIDNLLIRL